MLWGLEEGRDSDSGTMTCLVLVTVYHSWVATQTLTATL